MRGMWAAFVVACAVFAGLSLPVHAQQRWAPDASGVAPCVEGAGPSLVQLQKCKGVGVESCIETDAGSTTAGMMMCWQAHTEAWRAVLDAAMTRAAAGASPLRREALARSQENWTTWRASECQYRALIYEGGSLARVASAACYADLTADRAIAFLYAERNADE